MKEVERRKAKYRSGGILGGENLVLGLVRAVFSPNCYPVISNRRLTKRQRLKA